MNDKSNVRPRGWPPHSDRLVVIVHEVGHFLIGLSTGREGLEIRFTDGEGICLYKPWKWDTFNDCQVQQGELADSCVHVAGSSRQGSGAAGWEGWPPAWVPSANERFVGCHSLQHQHLLRCTGYAQELECDED